MKINDLKNSLLFSADVADTLNEAFAKATAPYLFLFCNYNPAQLCKSNGKTFTNAIGNIYRICNDTGRIIRKREIFDPDHLTLEDDKKFFRDYLSLLDDLRSYDDHNNSPNNGDLQKETIEKAEAFYKNKTGKEYKDLDENDFEKLIEIIFYNTEQFRSLIEKIIKSIDKSPNKSIIIENCKSHIIKYYSLPIYRNIILGQVKTLMKEQSDNEAQRLFQYYLSRYSEPISIGEILKPKEFFDYYMNNCFESNIKDFLEKYIVDPDATLLPQGLIQNFIDSMIYPVKKGDKIELNLSKMTYRSDPHRFIGKDIIIKKLKLNVMVTIDNNIEDERLEYLKNSEKEICTAQYNMNIKNYCNSKSQFRVVICTISD